MCGFVGLVAPHGKQIDVSLLNTMVKRIHHRGPDDSGTYLNPNSRVGLGSTRLSIQDLSPLGHMPMANADGTVHIAFNGEIYNFKEKRRELESNGHSFRSGSDTEVILALYDEYGVDCLNHLRGMFAFALWDEKRQRLFCARDRLGKKPFKYFWDGHRFSFASELKAILMDPSIPRDLDPVALHHYLSFQYVPAPQTGFKNLYKLPAAHYLLLEQGQLSVHRYWTLDYRTKLHLSESEWKERLTEKLRESVRLRMISDVPLGAFLSGGIDSSLVVALMSEISQDPVKTFSIGFNEPRYDERPYARRVAEYCRTDHHEFVMEPQSLDLLDALAEGYEEPYADPAAIPTYYLSKMARQHVTVALNGDGGDENFAGYAWYNIHQFAARYQKIPLFFRKHLITPGTAALAHLLKTRTLHRAERFSRGSHEGLYRQYFQYLCFFPEEDKPKLLTPDFWAQLQAEPTRSTDWIESLFRSAPANNDLDKALSVDIQSYLADCLLPKVDIATMMNSLEGRSPLLDHELMELTAQIPSSLKLKGHTKKYIFKKTAEAFLPREILYRKKKGFGVPLDYWFKNELKTFMGDTLLEGRLIREGIVQRSEVERLLRLHQTTSIDFANRLWALLTLEKWFSLYQVRT